MTPGDLAALHEASFTTPRPWSADEFQDLLDAPGVCLLTGKSSFLLGRIIGDEAEILTIAVDPAERRKGTGRKLVEHFIAICSAEEEEIEQIFLEVAADNDAALALYQRTGFTQTGRRAGYYAASGGKTVDALVLLRDLAG